MRIAYYSFGNVQEPRDDLHTEKGEPILQKGEVILAQDTDAGFELTRVPGGIIGKIFPTIVFPDIGRGELYRTDRNIMFFRIPPITQYGSGVKAWIDDPMKFMRMAKKWLQKGHRESAIIPIKYVKKTVRKRGDKEIVLHIVHMGDKYIARDHSEHTALHVSMGLPPTPAVGF